MPRHIILFNIPAYFQVLVINMRNRVQSEVISLIFILHILRASNLNCRQPLTCANIYRSWKYSLAFKPKRGYYLFLPALLTNVIFPNHSFHLYEIRIKIPTAVALRKRRILTSILELVISAHVLPGVSCLNNSNYA